MNGVRRALAVGLLVTAPTACAGDVDEPVKGPGSPASRGDAQPPPSTGPSVAAAAASRLTGVAGCEAGEQFADLTWQVADPPGERQRVVLSLLDDGLETDAHLASPPLRADQGGYRWPGLGPGAEPRYWRVLTLRDGQWWPSETATFAGHDCGG